MNFPDRFRVLCKASEGGAMIELVSVIPFFLLLLFGVIDLGRVYYVRLEVVSAAHAGAEFGSQSPNDTAGITAAARQSAPELSNMTVAVPTWGCECSDGSSYTANCATTPTCTASSNRGSNVVHRVQVTTSVIYSTWIPWPGIPASFTLSSTATMRGN